MERALKLSSPTTRDPVARDYVLFFVVMPVLWAFWLAMSGIRLVSYMSVAHGYAYMIIHCTVAWWAAHMGTRMMRAALARWRPPVWVLLVSGWALNLVPMAFFYYWLTDAFAQYYPAMTPFVASMQFEWSADYPLRFLRGCLPWLVVWMLAVYGYRLLARVDWYGYGEPTQAAAPLSKAATDPVPEFLRRSSRLPLDAEILALKAEEHYVQIWSTAGKDLIRYRFRDAVAEMPRSCGLQVHRSWWVSPRHVTAARCEGRRMALQLPGELTVPVSQAHVSEVRRLIS